MMTATASASSRLSALLSGIAPVAAAQDLEVSGLCLDSRAARAGDLFLACAGLRSHGADYLDQALRAGVAAVAWEPRSGFESLPALDDAATVPAFAVPDLSRQVGVIADRFYGHPSSDMCVVGITGTDGKTSCAQFLAGSLHRAEAPCGVIGTLGYGLYGATEAASHTTPDALRLQRLLAQMRDAGARCVVMEVSSHALEQGRVNGVNFDVAVLTNLSRDHLDYHGDERAYARAKRRLFELADLRTAVLNLNDAFGRELSAALPAEVTPVGYGLEPLPASEVERQVVGSALQLGDQGLRMQVASPWGEGEVRAPLLGRFNAANVLAVFSVLLSLGWSFDRAREAMAALPQVPGRMERFGGGDRPVAIVDYAHTPDALRHVLGALREHCRGTLWCVFGCGGDRDRGKRPLMGAAAEQLADRVVVTDDNPRNEDPDAIVADILAGMESPQAVVLERDRASAIRQALTQARPGDMVLVAGKGHEDYQLVGDRRLPFSDRTLVRQVLREGAW
jgi:UDP-N-acetylmuramoyl-L-alanyl-D-glutamate--2,6-diaminopimelate ligase